MSCFLAQLSKIFNYIPISFSTSVIAETIGRGQKEVMFPECAVHSYKDTYCNKINVFKNGKLGL